MNNQEILSKKIKEAKEGNQKAFSYLLDEFWTDVYNFQQKRIGDENDVEDVVIQTFAKAFDKINTYNEEFSFKTWLIAISKNVHVDMIRDRKRSLLHTFRPEENEVITIADETPTVEDRLIIEQNLHRLLICIKQLKEPYRTVIQLRYLQEKSYKEIAEITANTLSNVKVVLLRAKKMLAEIIRNS
ncbi:RNA polymerase sigma factor [Capnocytophaga canimorsus]|uniref:RNA polymerase subunit sigma-70 n=1 Tax=Capnocytophaga canimorsus TaxID=28188 RepID=A0AAD0E9Q9_9FLAO|nr:RNA polymerase sigma factor [Capnocytophaga canimorsus]ATA93411.1 RNA polymerase subunit sigma-70 [Capnocytophaga canimorsus]GJQ05295.1 DNA-directed RNA polymerase sigma-70 factor [Capnocytophaga canimorsus]